MHKHLHLPGTDKQVAGIIIGTQETVTVTVAYNSPADKLFLLQNGIAFLFGKLNLPLALHGAQASLNTNPAVFVLGIYALANVHKGHGFAMLFKGFQQIFAAGYRIVVLGFFPLVVRIICHINSVV